VYVLSINVSHKKQYIIFNSVTVLFAE